MKTTKTTKTTKKFIPLYTVDLTDLETPNDIVEAFVVARFDAGLGLSSRDRDIFIDSIVDVMHNIQDMTCELCDAAFNVCERITAAIDNKTIETPKVEKEEKKPNIFKRFWNWITRK